MFAVNEVLYFLELIVQIQSELQSSSHQPMLNSQDINVTITEYTFLLEEKAHVSLRNYLAS